MPLAGHSLSVLWGLLGRCAWRGFSGAAGGACCRGCWAQAADWRSARGFETGLVGFEVSGLPTRVGCGEHRRRQRPVWALPCRSASSAPPSSLACAPLDCESRTMRLGFGCSTDPNSSCPLPRAAWRWASSALVCLQWIAVAFFHPSRSLDPCSQLVGAGMIHVTAE